MTLNLNHVENPTPKKAILLLSGGIDSVTVLAMLKKQNVEIHAMSFSYGQRHSVELKAVQKILQKHPVATHRLVSFDLRSLGGSALTGSTPVPKTDTFEGETFDVPVTYVPARNTLFLSFALALGETLGVYDIYMGANKLDRNNYPDCRPEFFEAFEKLAASATAVGTEGKGRFRVHTPLTEMTKAEVIQEGLRLGLDYSITTSCYDPSSDGKSCGKCGACHFRLEGFRANEVADPAPYNSALD